jgi:hypothetical protein
MNQIFNPMLFILYLLILEELLNDILQILIFDVLCKEYLFTIKKILYC